MKKPVVGLFHNSSAESEAPGTEINRPVLLADKNEKTVTNVWLSKSFSTVW